jgi:8-oxo-dGTP pyrophosphatase MutT (NUDIX family)
MRKLLRRFKTESSSRPEKPGERMRVHWENEYVEMREIIHPEFPSGYFYLHCHGTKGHTVAVIGFRRREGGLEFLIRKEISPAWGLHPMYCALQGGYEGGDIRENAARELKEESGYTAHPDELIELGKGRASKSTDTLYHMFAVDLTGKPQGEEEGDGSHIEAISPGAEWVQDIDVCGHAVVHMMYLRLLKYLGLA